MLRGLVVVLLLVNAGLWLWLQSDPNALQADREPQRLGREVLPAAIEVLPDLPASAPLATSPAASAASEAAAAGVAASGAANAATAPSAAAPRASAPVKSADASGAAAKPVTVSLVGASGANAGPARASAASLDCSESTALDDTQVAALRQALARAGVPASALSDRRHSQGGTWAIYMGRFTDSQAWQNKADELRRLDIAFERVNSPPALAPGLSLGQYPSAGEAQKKLDELARHGVHTARVVPLTAPTIHHFLQIRGADPAWRHATGSQVFGACAAEPSASKT